MSRIEYKDLPKIAIIGRPNVGKSSLFNLLLRRRKAIVESVPGVTRDRLYACISSDRVKFVLIDTGGILSKPQEKIAELVYNQSGRAIAEADAVIFVCDVASGPTYEDEHIASLLQKSGKKIFLAVNKIDNERLENERFLFFKLGLGEPYGISAVSNRGINRLLGAITDYLSKEKQAHRYSADVGANVKTRIAVVGRPNVGKSSFINCILNEERLLVDSAPGTTRDSVDVSIQREGRILELVDTAGIKHKRKLKETVEIFSLARTKESIRNADVVIVILDIGIGLTRDDIAVLSYVIKQKRPCVVLVNKTDLINNLDMEEYKRFLRERLRPLKSMPIIFTSCFNKKNIIKAIDTACALAEKSVFSISTHKLNEFLQRIQGLRPHPLCGKSRPKIYYATQIEKSPLKFLMFCSDPRLIRKEYMRFIENSFRKEFDIFGLPVTFELKGKKEEI